MPADDEEGAFHGVNGSRGDDDVEILPANDPSAMASQKSGGGGGGGQTSGGPRNNVKSHKDKKIPNDQRSTTPFLTKYEKARILGTRALQIR